MTSEEHTNIIEQLRTCDDNTQRQTLLLNLSNDYTTMLAEREQQNTQVEQLTSERDNLAKVNNELWLSRNQQTNENNNVNMENDNSNNVKPVQRKFEDLKFD